MTSQYRTSLRFCGTALPEDEAADDDEADDEAVPAEVELSTEVELPADEDAANPQPVIIARAAIATADSEIALLLMTVSVLSGAL
jgi:hypothetical protein